MLFAIIFHFIISSLGYTINANDVLGCGGFIKSHVTIDFSKVEIKLYTKQGILKDRTTCAPNNGYYFIPLYDKGDYVLQLEPPAGWSFTPTKINLSVDGKTDVCSQGKDVNFVFKGFGITGRVESFGGDGRGPAGVQVQLKSDSDVRTSVTTDNGNFFFTPVYPGQYVVTVSHPKWTIKKGSITVTVTEGNTDLPPNSLVIGGYDVIGYIKSEGEPVKGANIILFQNDEDKPFIDVEGCDKSAISGFNVKNKFLCHVTSDSEGKFVFSSISSGNFYLMPFYKSHNIYFQPAAIEFSVSTGSVTLSEIFEITGFSISGRILTSQNGKPLDRALIYLDDQESGVTKRDGIFTLDGIKSGRYTLQVKAESLQFDEFDLRVNPNTLTLPDIYPTAYKVCGEVVSDKPQVVKITKVNTMQHFTLTTEEHSGFFCQYLGFGKYQIQVVVDEDERDKGVQFFPISQIIDVTTSPISGITFSQLKAELFGKVKCINKQDCDSLKVVLRQIINDVIQLDKDVICDLNNGNYVFDDVRPGSYEVFLTPNRFCWEKSKLIVVVTNATLTIPEIVQTGFSVTFISSHNSQVSYKHPGQETEVTTVNISKDKTSHCVQKSGLYTFLLEGCHTYEPNAITFDTSTEANEIYLSALKHKHTLRIGGSRDPKDLFITVNIGGIKTKEGPLKYKNDGYELELFLAHNENAILVPQSESLYFDPPILSISGSDDCIDLGVKFQAVKGLVFKGKIIPPLSDVEISVESENSDVMIDHTDSEGKYQFPPMDTTKSYKITAKKDSYVLVGPNNNGDFMAHKLAEIVVEVLDEVNNVPLQGALLSLSGGTSYRSNLQTNEHGKITFHSLSPSEYFLRPMLKEYNFEPPHKIISVKEGVVVHVQLRGKRVAYSAFGQITSLNKEPEEKMIVVASGTGNCSEYSEEASSEANGNFRIRGLIPYCSYEVAIKGSVNEDEVIERAAPPFIQINNVNSDIRNLHYIIFRPVQNTDILVKVFAPNVEHYKSLRLKMSRETAPAGLVHSMKLDIAGIKITDDYNSGVLVQLPSVPLDGKLYSVQLESSASHNNVLKSTVQYFTANSSFKFVDLEFVVKTNPTEQQIKQTSVWTLVFIFGTLFGIYNTDFLVQFIKERVATLNINSVNTIFRNKSPVRDYTVDNSEIDQIVESINVTKRKVKPRKV